MNKFYAAVLYFDNHPPTNYKFSSNVDNLIQHSVSVNLIIMFLRPVSINLAYEGIFELVRTSGRLLMNLSLRF